MVLDLILAATQLLQVCDATRPTGPIVRASQETAGNFGNEQLSTALWDTGVIVFKPGGPGFVTREGGLGMKFPWWRGVRGKLRVTGRRLDGDGASLRLEANDGYGGIGFPAGYPARLKGSRYNKTEIALNQIVCS